MDGSDYFSDYFTNGAALQLAEVSGLTGFYEWICTTPSVYDTDDTQDYVNCW